MFSQLGPLFKTQFRQAESNDTRQYIPHEEHEKHRKEQNEQQKKQSTNEAWVDDTSVSVGALRAFLIDFLKTIPGGQDSAFINNRTDAEELSSRPKEQKRPTSTHNARAVRAYQTMAAHSQSDTSSKSPDLDKAEDNNPTADKLESKELRDIHSLIVDLEGLEKKGVTTLHIFQADSFVESLKNAVLVEKAKP